MKKKLTTLLGLLFLIAGMQFIMAPQSSLIGQTYRILVRRGLAADLPALTAGEFGFTTDTKALYLGSSAGNLAIGGTGAEVRTAKFTVGDNAVVQGGDFRAGNDWTTEAGWHSFEAEPLIENHGGHGFAAYDSRPTMQGTGPYDHFVGFQSRPIYNSSGNLASYMAAFDTFPVHGGAGTVANGYGLLVRDFGGVGPITTDYGIYINEIWRGSTNYSLYVAGGTSWFGSGLKASLFSQNTADGADNSFLGIGGGGAANSVTRGGSINLFGNENALKGAIAYLGGAGDGATYGDHIWYGGGGPAEYMRLDGNTGRLGIGIDAPLDLLHVFKAAAPGIRTSFTTTTSAGGFAAYNDGGVGGLMQILGTAYAGGYGGPACLALINTGGPIALSPSGRTSPSFIATSTYSGLYAPTNDASDNAYIEFGGGGAASSTRGGVFNLFGNEHAQKGSVSFIAGVGDGAAMGNILFYGGGGPTELARFDQSGNFGLGLTAWGTSATKTFGQATGTAPTTSPADSFQLYSKDAGAVAGQAGPHFRTEGGGIFGMRSDTGTTLQYVYQKDDLADDGTVTLPDATSGMILVSCNAEAGMWLVQADGTVTKISGSTNTANTDADGSLCVYDGGTGAIVKNRLNATGEIRIVYYYN